LLNIGASLEQKGSDGAVAGGSDSAAGDAASDPFLNELLRTAAVDPEAAAARATDEAVSQLVTPVAALCLKTESEKGEKVFVNICTSEHVPPPPAVSDAELAVAVATFDNSKYRVPMSVGEPHAEVDSNGGGCTAYDVIVSNEAYHQFQERTGIKEFMVELILSHIEHKHSVLLSREYKTLQKRKRMGQLQQQRIRTKKKIHEVVTPGVRVKSGEAKLIVEAETDAISEAAIPEYTLIKEPDAGRPEFYVVEVALPDVRSANTMALDVGGRRLELSVHPKRYFLGLDFEHAVEHQDTGAQFDKKSRKLTVTLPVQPEV